MTYRRPGPARPPWSPSGRSVGDSGYSAPVARKRRAPRTLAEVAFANAGIRSGMHAITFMVQHGLATAELGHEPSLEEYCEIHACDRATFYRHQSAFRKGFPGEDSPARLNAASGNQERYDELVRSVKGSLADAAVKVQALMFTAGAAQFPEAGSASA